MNDDDLEQRLARLRPADLPGDLRRRLHAVEPILHAPVFSLGWHELLTRFLHLWPLAYSGLGTVWVVIITLHLLTRSSPTPAADYAPLAQSSANPSTPSLVLTAGSPTNRTLLLTRNNVDSLWP